MDLWLIVSPFIATALTIIIFWFWKPWAGAYAGEKGKNLARKEDLDAILAEVRAVTITQKEIEHKLSGDLWHQQVKWNHKRDAYLDLLKVAYKAWESYTGIAAILRHRAVSADEMHEFVQNQLPLITAFNVARIFLGKECVDAIDLCEHSLIPAQNAQPNSNWADRNAMTLRTLLTSVTEIAKRDLDV
jgi:hypothetical protein